MAIVLDQVSKVVDHSHSILNSTHLIIKEGITTALIGPSGCGKSTLLRLLVGLISPTTGQIYFDEQELTPQTVQHIRRQIGYVIQEGGLFPHLTALENVILLARFLKYDTTFIQKRINSPCQLVQLSPKILNLYPLQLSGGERQRVSLMRALMLDPAYLFLDEPLAALDPISRYELQQQLKQIFEALRKTVILVTHDMHEAAYFGHEIVLMKEGNIIQTGSFQELVKHPSDLFVSQFIQAQQPPMESIRC